MKKVIAITGTPGAGKTSVAEKLKDLGYEVYAVNELAEKLDCIMDYEDDCAIVDVEKLKKRFLSMPGGELVVVEGHLSHHLADTAIVLRCNPLTLKERLLSRGWSEDKVMENVEAELIDEILVESLETCREVYEINATEMSVDEVVEVVKSIISGMCKDYRPGSVDWISELGERIDEVIRL